VIVLLGWICILEASLHAVNAKFAGSLYIDDALLRFRFRRGARAWFTGEGQAFISINSRGFRDRERTTGPHQGLIRVAVIGDSTVAGLQVSAEATFTQAAERRLGPRVEVLNFGVPNYGLAQQYITLRDQVLAYQPDLVVAAVSLTNDILNSTRATAVNDSPYPYFLRQGDHLELSEPPALPSRNLAREAALLDLENRSDLYLLGSAAARVIADKAEAS
jgi:hypothetical protein